MPEVAPDRMDIALKLNRHFISWRDRILRRLYKQDHTGEMTSHLTSEEDEDRYVWEAGREDSWMHSYSGVPGPRYFWNQVMPTLLEIAETPEALEKAGMDAVEILEQLMTAELSYTRYHTSRELLENFFKNVDVARLRYQGTFAGGTNAEGQFKFLYTLGKPKNRKRRELVQNTRDELTTAVDPEKAAQLQEARKWLAMAVAKHQGWECDRHCGDGDYTNSTEKIKETFLPAYRAAPLSCRGKAMKAFVNYGGGKAGMEYLCKLPELLEELRKEGGEQYLEDYFTIVQHAPKLNHDLTDGRNFPVFDVQKLMQEFKGLEGMAEYKPEALHLMEWAVSHSDWRRTLACSFLKNETGDRYSTLHIPEVIGDLRGDGLKPEEVKRVLQLPVTEGWLGGSAIEVLRHYTALNSNFPGGIEALMDYLRAMKGADSCISNLLRLVQKGELTQLHQAEFLEKGRELVVLLGDDAAEYFNLFRAEYSIGGGVPSLKVLFEEDWEAFSKKIDELSEMTSRFSAFKEMGSAKVFARSLNFCLDAQFPEYKEGLLYLGEGLKRIFEEKRAKATEERKMLHMPDALLSVLVEHYWQSAYLSPPFKNDNFGRVFPENTAFLDHAKILLHHVEAEFSYGDTYGEYVTLVHQGMDFRVAAFLEPVRAGRRIVDYDWKPVAGLEEPKNKEEVLGTIRLFTQMDNRVEEILDAAPRRLVGRKSYSDPVCHELVPSDVLALRQIERELNLLEQGGNGHFLDYGKLKGKIDNAIRFSFLRDIISGACSSDVDQVEVSEDGFFRRTNPYTQMAIAGCSLLASVGSLRLPGVQVQPLQSEVFNVRCLLANGQEMGMDQLEATYRSYQAELGGRIRAIIPHVEAMVKNARSRMPGLMAVGGKIHTQRPMDEKTLDFVHKLFGFRNTPFKLIHAGSSLLIPPMPTTLERNMLIKILELLGVVDPMNPDIQDTIAGRWSETLAPYVGASVLLGTQRGVMYKKGAFGTTHDKKTGARIMAYDDGVKEIGLPYDVPSATGRTDMLGRHAYTDSVIYQLLGTLASHQQYDGVFHGKMPGVVSQLDFVLERHGLRDAMFSSAWVYDHAGKGDSLTMHEKMVRKFTQARLLSGPMGAVRLDIQALVEGVESDLMAERERVIQANPEEFDKLMNY